MVKRDPHTNLRNPVYKGLFSHLPESLHQLTIDFSDRGIPKSYRHARLRQPHLQLYQCRQRAFLRNSTPLPARH
ncbi:catalase [Serratia ureilytica]